MISDFSSAHLLKGYRGDCEELHGHNWKVEVTVSSERLDPIGLAFDFRELKTEVKKLLNSLDHRLLNEIKPFDRINPSSENLARFIYDTISREINREGVRVSRVRVWESEDASATYYE